MVGRIEQQQNVYDDQKGDTSSSKWGTAILECFLYCICIGVGVIGAFIVISGYEMPESEAIARHHYGGLCLPGSLWGMVSLIKKIPTRNKTVKDERRRTKVFQQEMLSGKEELEQELTTLEQDYNSFLARGLKNGWRKSGD